MPGVKRKPLEKKVVVKRVKNVHGIQVNEIVCAPEKWSNSPLDFALPPNGINVIPVGSASFHQETLTQEELLNLLDPGELQRKRLLDNIKKGDMRHCSQFARIIIDEHLEVILPRLSKIFAKMNPKFIPQVLYHVKQSLANSGLVDMDIMEIYCNSNIVVPTRITAAPFSTVFDPLILSEKDGIQATEVIPKRWSSSPIGLPADCGIHGTEISAGSSVFCTTEYL
jgi:hypothetical protein